MWTLEGHLTQFSDVREVTSKKYHLIWKMNKICLGNGGGVRSEVLSPVESIDYAKILEVGVCVYNSVRLEIRWQGSRRWSMHKARKVRQEQRKKALVFHTKEIGFILRAVRSHLSIIMRRMSQAIKWIVDKRGSDLGVRETM